MTTFRVGDLVKVLWPGNDQWMRNGVVAKQPKAAAAVDGLSRPAGAAEAVYSDNGPASRSSFGRPRLRKKQRHWHACSRTRQVAFTCWHYSRIAGLSLVPLTLCAHQPSLLFSATHFGAGSGHMCRIGRLTVQRRQDHSTAQAGAQAALTVCGACSGSSCSPHSAPGPAGGHGKARACTAGQEPGARNARTPGLLPAGGVGMIGNIATMATHVCALGVCKCL